MMIPITRPYLGEEEAAAAREVILSGWVTQGPKVKEFEETFALYVGSGYACAVSSCTTALHLALLAVGVEPGDVVVTVSHSFIATANAARHCFAEPVFVDIDPETFNMSPGHLESLLKEECEEAEGALYLRGMERLARGESPLRFFEGCSGRRPGRVAAVVPVHQMGMPCDLNAIIPIARRYGIPVVEDAACAAGSEILADGKWERIGRPHGDVACFSFHPRKIITTGDGGMITTGNPEYDRRLRLLRNQGMDVSASERHNAAKAAIENYVTTGYNYRMTDIQAAVGIVQLGRLPEMVAKRRGIASLYREKLGSIGWLKAPSEPQWCRTNWQSYSVSLAGDAPVGRDGLLSRLLGEGVSAKPGIMNAHLEPPYSGLSGFSLERSEFARDSVILLPMYYAMEDNDVDRVVEVLAQ
jgi:dTDP-4-amino-4,6-dideoxygalactose transaminase